MSFLKFPNLLRAAFAAFVVFVLIATAPRVEAQAPPATFTRTIATGSGSVTVQFALHPIRTSNFGVFVQQSDGSYFTHVADVPRTYIGRVNELPGAIACGLLQTDGTLWARIFLEDGKTWTTFGGVATLSGTDTVPT